VVKPLAAAAVAASLAVAAPSQNTPEVRRAAGASAVVAADGTGDYTTIQAAIDAVPQTTRADRPWTIAVRNGRYREIVYVQREKRFVRLIGENPEQSILTFDLRASANGPNRLPMGTFRTPTLQIDADDFTVENLTVENSAGPVGQALAVRVDGDRAIFRHVRLLGWQDTLFLNRGRQYFEDSVIAGHVDFIFGGATAFFERCELHLRGDGYITAASTPPEQPHGFVFANGRITGEPGAQAFLGRPWRDFAAVAFLNTTMSGVVRPEGWHNWDRPERERTVRYAEGGSTGDGATVARRVPWARQLSAADVRALSVAAVLGGADHWSPQLVNP
jgi:pectinesterase